MKQLVLVLGAGGQLGQVMAERLGAQHAVVARTRGELDAADAVAVRRAVEDICPDVIVNCVAYTDVEGAETHPVAALAANAWVPRLLARIAAEIDATLVHFSTDFVFDGCTTRPYVETDEPNPRGTYAVSKLLGEWLVAEAPRHYVLRVESLFGGVRAHSSIDAILKRIRSGEPVRAFCDRTVSPSYVEDVVEATSALLGTGAPFGLYHCVNSGWTDWAALARHLAVLAGRPEAVIEPVPMASAGLTVERPQFAALANDKLGGVGIRMPDWQDALARHVATVR